MIDKTDKILLLESAAFRRLLFALIQAAGLFDASATEARLLFQAGRRSLALDLLHSLEEAQPRPSDSGIPLGTLIQTLCEQAQSTRKEIDLGRRYDDDSDPGDDG